MGKVGDSWRCIWERGWLKRREKKKEKQKGRKKKTKKREGRGKNKKRKWGIAVTRQWEKKKVKNKE